MRHHKDRKVLNPAERRQAERDRRAARREAKLRDRKPTDTRGREFHRRGWVDSNGVSHEAD